MSYRFDMCFAAANSIEDAMVFANEFVNKMAKGDCIVKMMEEEKCYIPSLRRSHRLTVESLNTAKAEDEAWLYQLLSPHFVFWPAAKLVGLVGGSWPNREEFFPENVYFQNSCDQDYDLDSWPKLPFFEKIVKRHRSMDAEELLRNGRWNDYTKEEIDDNLDYYIRSDAYDQIYSMLCLDDWLWGKENSSFQRFSFSAICSEEQKFELLSCLRGLSMKYNPELWEPVKTKDGWIPCEKLMPEKSTEVKFFDGHPRFATVLATYRYADSPNTGSGPTNYTQLEDGAYEWSVIHTGMADEVIAWMPIPKPYS